MPIETNKLGKLDEHGESGEQLASLNTTPTKQQQMALPHLPMSLGGFSAPTNNSIRHSLSLLSKLNVSSKSNSPANLSSNGSNESNNGDASQPPSNTNFSNSNYSTSTNLPNNASSMNLINTKHRKNSIGSINSNLTLELEASSHKHKIPVNDTSREVPTLQRAKHLIDIDDLSNLTSPNQEPLNPSAFLSNSSIFEEDDSFSKVNNTVTSRILPQLSQASNASMNGMNNLGYRNTLINAKSKPPQPPSSLNPNNRILNSNNPPTSNPPRFYLQSELSSLTYSNINSNKNSIVSGHRAEVKPAGLKTTASALISNQNLQNNINNNNNNNSNLAVPHLPPKRRVSENDLKRKEEKDKRLRELELLNTIGTGTFGRVMVARHQTTKKYFALKIMSIFDIIKLKQIEHVKNEKNVLENIDNPFIVKLYWTHHTEQYLYMLLEYVPGGELFTLLRQRNKFETKAAIFYAAEIVSALEYLHSKQVVYRDLKPENILVNIFIYFLVLGADIKCQ
jgi:hypothetical protein